MQPCHQTARAENSSGDDLRKDAEAARSQRQQFWMDTCREARQRKSSSPQVLELYQTQGCRFSAPTAEQVQEILDALDSALPHWEQEHPELFYQTLQLNFPELVRVCLAGSRG